MTAGASETWLSQAVGELDLEPSIEQAIGPNEIIHTGAGHLPHAKSEERFSLLSQFSSGDLTLEASLLGLEGTLPTAGAGLMLRESLAVNSGYVWIGVRKTGVLAVHRRLGTGQSSATKSYGNVSLPVSFRIVRTGGEVAVWTKTGPERWEVLEKLRVTWSAALEAGVAVFSGRDNEAAQARWQGL